ncbi:Hypothetical_protein [Hexamita inflata]|uniref:Hypothetical_protein n=1 Tax=Hexamita inflata TaxID=28002 RepID=A0AA86PIF1_9EUKA|nr:Hypothetical protein HINF_LOCUS27920 [Hexamita inflata]
MINLPSFALFGLTQNIQIINSNLTVKVPQQLSQCALICFSCDVNASSSEFAFISQGFNTAGLAYSPNSYLLLNSSLIQFRLNGYNIGGLVLRSSQLTFSFYFCNISGYAVQQNISGSLIAFALDQTNIFVDNCRICVNIVDYIGNGRNNVDITGILSNTCDLCGDLYQMYGICQEDIDYTEVIENQAICIDTFVFDGNQCSCPSDLQISGNQCINILDLIESQQQRINSLQTSKNTLQDKISMLQEIMNTLVQQVECTNKTGYTLQNGTCTKSNDQDFMQCLLNIEIYVSTFDISGITNQITSNADFNSGYVFDSRNDIQNAYIDISDEVYSSNVVLPLFQSQISYSNIKIQIGTQTITKGSIMATVIKSGV